jgi:hypothetical protein
MRYAFRFGFALALGIVLAAGCTEDSGEGGSGGTAGMGGGGAGGEGGSGGSAGTGGTGGTGGFGECTGVENGTECALRASPGVCLDGACHVNDCSAVDDGTDCAEEDLDGYAVGLCVAGSCEWGLERCENDDVCRAYNDCIADICLGNGLCEDRGALDDGTPCAGGTCQGGECALEGSVLPCSEQGIRNAIAAGDGPYTFDCDGPKSVLTQAQIVVDNNVILDGEGRLTVDGGGTHRVLFVEQGIALELRSLTIANGGDDEGGGILSRGALTLVDSVVRDCTSGGIAIWSVGTLTLIGSTVSGNQDGGIHNGGRSTVLLNSTVSGNSADRGGGIATGLSPFTIINSTLSGNSPDAIFADRDPEDPPVDLTVTGSLIEGECVFGGVATLVSNGHNVESPGDTCGFDQATDQVNVSGDDLKLGPLADNGGPTETHALGASSVAINQIPGSACLDAEGEPLTTDQRGEPRDSMCDVGAFEVQP